MHITNRIGYPFLKILVFVICFVSYEYNESNQKIWIFCLALFFL